MATKKDGNLNDALVSRRASDEEAAKFDLAYHLSALMLKEPFFAAVLRIITKIKTKRISTAGVSAAHGSVVMYWNPNFMAGLNDKEVLGLLKHECYHLVFEHTTKRHLEPHEVHNYAADLAINCLIDKDELPNGGLIPGENFVPLTPAQVKQMGQKAADRYDKVSKLISSLPKNESTEWYFSKLMEDDEVSEAIQQASKMKGKSLGQALADGDVRIDENGDLVDKDGNPVTMIPGTSDEHDDWGAGLSEEERELIKGQIKDTLRKAVNNCDNSNSWGSISESMRKRIRELVKGAISWKAVLKRFCGTTRRADRTSSVRRLNRKYPGVHPGNYKNYRASIAVYLDQSGSVSDSDLELLGGELMHLSKRIEFVLFNFDTSVDEKSRREYRKGKFSHLERTRCGGTDFRCVQDHANKHKDEFDGYLVLTDGYAPDPGGKNRLKRGWIIVPTGELQFKASKRDFVIKMKNKKSS